jgi:hypothetical protein
MRSVKTVNAKDARFMAKAWDSLDSDGALKWVGSRYPALDDPKPRDLYHTGDDGAPPLLDIGLAYSNVDGAVVKPALPRRTLTHADYSKFR